MMDVVLRGNPKLYAIMKEKDALYAKPDFPRRTESVRPNWRANSPSWTAGRPKARQTSF